MENVKKKKWYRIWLSKDEFIDVEAECPSIALKAPGVPRWFWKIETLDRKEARL